TVVVRTIGRNRLRSSARKARSGVAPHAAGRASWRTLVEQSILRGSVHPSAGGKIGNIGRCHALQPVLRTQLGSSKASNPTACRRQSTPDRDQCYTVHANEHAIPSIAHITLFGALRQGD